MGQVKQETGKCPILAIKMRLVGCDDLVQPCFVVRCLIEFMLKIKEDFILTK